MISTCLKNDKLKYLCKHYSSNSYNFVYLKHAFHEAWVNAETMNYEVITRSFVPRTVLVVVVAGAIRILSTILISLDQMWRFSFEYHIALVYETATEKAPPFEALSHY